MNSILGLKGIEACKIFKNIIKDILMKMVRNHQLQNHHKSIVLVIKRPFCQTLTFGYCNEKKNSFPRTMNHYCSWL